MFPEYHLWEQYATDTMGGALRLDALRSSHPIQVPIKHAEEVEQVFDAISYYKGSGVVRMVTAFLGPEKFQAGLQLYMNRHKYGNTTTNDLWQAWSDVSGVDVSLLMDAWTRQMGFPYLSVTAETWTDSEVSLTLEQQWFLSDGSGTEAEVASKLWPIPLLFATPTSVSSTAVIMKDRKQTFKLPLDPASKASQWVKINAGQKALIRVSYTSTSINRLQDAIRNKLICVEDRAAILLDAYALAKAGVGSLEAVVDLLRAYDSENSSSVWTAIEGVLGGLHSLMEQVGGSANEAFVAFAKSIVLSALDRVGWGGEKDDHGTKLVRVSVLNLVETFCRFEPVVVTEAMRRFEAHWETPSELPSEYKSVVYRIVLQNSGVAEFERILASFYATQDNTERKHVMMSIGASRDAALRHRVLQWAVEGSDVKLQDFFYPIRAVANAGVAGVNNEAWVYFKQNMALIKNKLAKASPSLMDAAIIMSLCRHVTLEDANEVEQFFQSNPLPSSQRKIAQTVEGIRSSGTMLERVKNSALAQADIWKL